jgi:ABC-type branched-subunit amino acid transport system ATPase component/ABC-type branched-subunit amino acid transport system permease subunit
MSALEGAPAQLAAAARRRERRAIALFAIAGLATLVLPLVLPLQSYHLNVLMQATTYAIAVLGLTVVLGYTGQINLAQAGFFGIGAYAVALGTATYALPFWIALVLGVVLAALAGAALGMTSLRLGGHYLAMITISFQTILSLVLANWVSFTRGPDGVTGIKRPSILGWTIAENSHYLVMCIVALYLVGYLVWRLGHSKLGRAMQAVRDNELAAGVVGVNAYATKVTAFMLSAVLGGFGGGLFAGGFTYVSPDQFSFNESVVFLTMALLGGARSPFGAALGTALLILLPEWLRFLKVVYLAVYGLAVILIMVFLPEGIWGSFAALRRRLRPPERVSSQVPPLPLTLRTAAPEGGTILEVRDLSKHFGGLKAVDAVSFGVRANTVHALIGPNGSGKTTLLNVLSGIYVPTGGTTMLGGRDVTRLKPHERAAAGVGRTFQNIRLFPAMSVLDNVIVGAQRAGNEGVDTDAARRELALAALGFVGLAPRAHDSVQSLSYGHQRLVEIARSLAGNPKLLLLDEPGAGLNHHEKQELVALLKRLRGHGLTIFIIDHDMNLVEQLADHITVLNFGRRIADGAPADVLRHPEVIKAYLGEEANRAVA